MLDGISFDQLRTFITAVDQGSFSAAARHLNRSQSAVSDLIANLETQMAITLFDRSGRYPKLTDAGTILLADARGIVSNVDFMKARAKGISTGIEPELSAAIDVFFPMEALTQVARSFQQEFPQTPLRLYVEALGGVFQPLLDGRASVGIVAPLPIMPPSLSSEHLANIGFVMVAAQNHPLAKIEGIIPLEEVARHVQLVLTDRTDLSRGKDMGVMSPSTWRIADLYAKHAFLLNGLGWGGMPRHTVKADLESGKLVELQIENMPPGGLSLSMTAVYPTHAPPGPAARWLIDRLKLCPGRRPTILA